jgi:putative PIN family toxin of toxin-antitoxin system
VRVVFDTNVLVSALVLPGSRADLALGRVATGRDHLLLSRPLLDELLSVMARKFGREPEELARIALFLDELGEVVEPRERVRVLDDEPDNRLLECALAGGAEAIVSGDRRVLALRRWRGIEVLSLARYLEL